MSPSAQRTAPIPQGGEVSVGFAAGSSDERPATGRQEADLPVLEADPEWAWAPYESSGDRPWDPALAAHLFRRAGFGAQWGELQEALEIGPQAAIDGLVAGGAYDAESTGGWGDALAAAARSGNAETYVAWWLRLLLESPSVLRERMTLFWHNHFAVSAAAMGDLGVFHRQVQGLRSGGLGGVGALLRTQLAAPGMFVALGGSENRRSQPNATFARPWLEEFTVGRSVCSEADVRDAARALTGWFVYGGRLRWIEREHDDGEKTVLGHTGSLDREGLAGVLAEHPGTARTVTRRLWRWLVSETTQPGEALLGGLAELLRGTDGVRRTVETVLRSNLFFSEHAVGQKIKSPLELLIGLGRAFEMLLPTQPMAKVLGDMGQRLDAPPTLRGWAGGVNWISSMTVDLRQRACRAVVEGKDGFGKGLEAGRLIEVWGCADTHEAADRLATLLIPGGLSPEAEARIRGVVGAQGLDDASLRGVVLAVLGLPSFQLN